MSARLLAITWRKFRLAENLRTTRSARHLYFSKVLAATHLYFLNLTTAFAHKNKHTAGVLANARKDHSIPLVVVGVFTLLAFSILPFREIITDVTSSAFQFLRLSRLLRFKIGFLHLFPLNTVVFRPEVVV